MSAAEREQRSRLAKMIRECGLLRGTLLVRRRVCGKKGCRCTRGEKHEGLALQVSLEGRSRQFHVPRDMEEDVRRWVAQYKEVRERLDKVALRYLDRLRGTRK
jgi:hypothetical protein